ncbi:ATP-binding cassette domain-containing protein [Pajaroellobacter abortibovis]|nr:ATP-binding cassette domain-containing protein [Pajaroellobacter abortibovis]
MSTDVMIYTHGLTKSYGSFRAVDRVSFEVRQGEVVGFLGPNGAGKSTTMRILTCFLAPTQGTARIKGYDIFDDHLSVRRSLGYLPQRAPLYLEMGVLEYLRFASDLRQLDPVAFPKRAKHVIEVCGLAQVLGKEIRHLSHGYRQRVGLAQALIHDPPILILDEPTSDLDPNEKAEFLQYLKQIGTERTILLSTHNLSEVESACGRAIIISSGRVVADGPLEEIRMKSGRIRYLVSVQDSVGADPSAYLGTGSAPKQDEVVALIKKIPHVDQVIPLATEEKAHAFEITSDREADIRPQLFRAITDKGWVLLEMHKDTQSLEDVFRDLTIGDSRMSRRLDSSSRDMKEIAGSSGQVSVN